MMMIMMTVNIRRLLLQCSNKLLFAKLGMFGISELLVQQLAQALSQCGVRFLKISWGLAHVMVPPSKWKCDTTTSIHKLCTTQGFAVSHNAYKTMKNQFCGWRYSRVCRDRYYVLVWSVIRAAQNFSSKPRWYHWKRSVTSLQNWWETPLNHWFQKWILHLMQIRISKSHLKTLTTRTDTAELVMFQNTTRTMALNDGISSVSVLLCTLKSSCWYDVGICKWLRYTVCLKKNIRDIFSRNSRKHCWIFIMFGTRVTEKVSNQEML